MPPYRTIPSNEEPELRTLAGHSDWVWSVVYSPDGRYLASGSVDNTIKLGIPHHLPLLLNTCP